MTDHQPEIVEVATTRIGPSYREKRERGVRRNLSVVVIILLALAVPVIGVLGPQGVQRLDFSYLIPTPPGPSPSPTRTPRPTPTPAPPTPSPPPVVTTGEGPVPAAIPIDFDGIRLIDPATAEMGPLGRMRGYTDAIFRGPNGGWLCVCFGRTYIGQRESVEIVVRYLDGNAVERSATTIATIESVVDPPAQDFDAHLDVELSPDGRIAYVAVAARRIGGWTISLEVIDITRGTSIGRTNLASVDVPPPTAQEVNEGYGTWLSGPYLRLSPDGDRLLVSHWLEKNTAAQSERQALSVSLIDVGGTGRGGPAVGVVTPLGGAIAEAIGTCWFSQWLTEESILGLCWREEPGVGQAPVDVALFGLDGSRLTGFDYTPDPDYWATDPVLDVANRRVYLWNPVGHQLDVIDLDSRHAERLTIDPGGPKVLSERRLGGAPRWPGWAWMRSDYAPWSLPALLPDPRGTRLFALGMKEGPMSYDRGQAFGSTGIWVFDSATLELVDHWPAAAPYVGLGASRDGRWIYAISQGGADTNGVASGWPQALTVHDATDGRLAVQLAAFDDRQSLLFAP